MLTGSVFCCFELVLLNHAGIIRRDVIVEKLAIADAMDCHVDKDQQTANAGDGIHKANKFAEGDEGAGHRAENARADNDDTLLPGLVLRKPAANEPEEACDRREDGRKNDDCEWEGQEREVLLNCGQNRDLHTLFNDIVDVEQERVGDDDGCAAEQKRCERAAAHGFFLASDIVLTKRNEERNGDDDAAADVIQRSEELALETEERRLGNLPGRNELGNLLRALPERVVRIAERDDCQNHHKEREESAQRAHNFLYAFKTETHDYAGKHAQDDGADIGGNTRVLSNGCASTGGHHARHDTQNAQRPDIHYASSEFVFSIEDKRFVRVVEFFHTAGMQRPIGKEAEHDHKDPRADNSPNAAARAEILQRNLAGCKARANVVGRECASHGEHD